MILFLTFAAVFMVYRIIMTTLCEDRDEETTEIIVSDSVDV